jgi:hypothetical protein
MRALALVGFLTCAGCGRYGFDQQRDSVKLSDASGDGRSNLDGVPDAVATKGFAYPTFTPCPTTEFQFNVGNVGSFGPRCNAARIRFADMSDGAGGTVIWKTPLTVKTTLRFQMRATVLLDPQGAAMPADGMVFFVHASAQGPTAVGAVPDFGYQGLSPSMGFELDTFKDTGDPSANHVGFNVDGNSGSVVTATPSFALAGTTPTNVWVDYDGPTAMWSLFLSKTVVKPTVAVLKHRLDLVPHGPMQWFGIAAGGGNAPFVEIADVLSWDLTVTE